MPKKPVVRTVFLFVISLLVIGGAFYFIGGGKLPFSTAAISQVQLSADNSYWLVHATINTRSTFDFEKDSVSATDSQGKKATPKSTITVELEPVSTTYFAPAYRIIQVNEGDLGLCSLGIWAGQCLGYGRSDLVPYQYQAGVTQVKYKVRVLKNDRVIDEKTISYGRTEGGATQNVEGIQGDSISLANGDVRITSIAQLGGGYSRPEMADVVVFYDSRNRRWSPAASKDDVDRLITYDNRFYDCEGFDRQLSASDCYDFARKRAFKEHSNANDNLAPPSGYGNFVAGGESFSASEGSWQLLAGSAYADVTVAVSTRLADTVFVGNEVAKPKVLSVTVPSTKVGKLNQVQATIKNDGAQGGVDIKAFNANGNYIIPSLLVQFNAGETKTVPIDFYGQIEGSETFTVTACGISQFTSTDCDTKSGTGEITAPEGSGGGTDLGGKGKEGDCQKLGKDWSWNDDKERCVKEKPATEDVFGKIPLFGWILVAVVILIVVIYLTTPKKKGGKKGALK